MKVDVQDLIIHDFHFSGAAFQEKEIINDNVKLFFSTKIYYSFHITKFSLQFAIIY